MLGFGRVNHMMNPGGGEIQPDGIAALFVLKEFVEESSDAAKSGAVVAIADQGTQITNVNVLKKRKLSARSGELGKGGQNLIDGGYRKIIKWQAGNDHIVRRFANQFFNPLMFHLHPFGHRLLGRFCSQPPTQQGDKSFVDFH